MVYFLGGIQWILIDRADCAFAFGQPVLGECWVLHRSSILFYVVARSLARSLVDFVCSQDFFASNGRATGTQ